jgi:hypothetical protein
LKGFKVGKFLFASFGLLVLVSAVMPLLKGLALLGAMVIEMMLLAGLYLLSPTAFYAVCILAAIPYQPKAVWPWIASRRWSGWQWRSCMRSTRVCDVLRNSDSRLLDLAAFDNQHKDQQR